MPKTKENKRSRPSTRRKTLKPVPNFKSLEEEARFWDTHDTTEYGLEDLDETIEVAGPLKARVEKRRAERLETLLKLERAQLRATRKIAQRKGITAEILIKAWIDEGLRREEAQI
jgi:hypothetical protein